jgi:copper chaperone CopZ
MNNARSRIAFKRPLIAAAVIAFSLSFISSAQAAKPARGIQIDSGVGGDMKGYALVIGNSRYRFTSPLSNPANDATDIATALQDLGFEVTLKVDATHRVMENAVLKFGRTLRKGGVGLFYFAGHGVQVGGRNYLIPIDANVDSESDIKFETVDAGRILGKMEDAGNGTNIIILDACRNNPFVSKFRTAHRGLAKMEAPTGSILAYSTAPGSVAADGEGRNGLYTEKLLKYLKKEGLTIEDCFKKVRVEVMEASGKKQVPWESSSLTANFYFISPKKVEVVQDTSDKKEVVDKSADILFWESVKDSKDPTQYEFYMKKFPNGTFVDLAKLYIEMYGQKSETTDRQSKADGNISSVQKKPATTKSSMKKTIPAAVEKNPLIGAPKTENSKKLKVAILPSYFGSFVGVTSLSGFDQDGAVYRGVKSNKYINVVYNYKKDKNPNRDFFWEKQSAFGKPELNIAKALNFGNKIDSDVILAVRTNPEQDHSILFDIFILIIDIDRSKTFLHLEKSVFSDNYIFELENSVKLSLHNYLEGNNGFFEIQNIELSESIKRYSEMDSLTKESVATSPAKPKSNTKTGSSKIKIAFLPSIFQNIQFGGVSEKYQYQSAKTAIENITEVELSYSYFDSPQSDANIVWKKKSILSTPSIDIKTVKRLCMELGADIAVSMRTYGDQHVYNVETFLVAPKYDANSRYLMETRDFSMIGDIQSHLKIVIKKFINKNSIRASFE